jgi:aspartate racemase
MKHIGIVDITTVGACLCANEIVAQAAKIDASKKHPEFTMHAFSYDQYYDYICRKDWISLANKICESIKLLEKVGADFIIIPSNAPHFAIDLIEKKSPLPVVNLIKIVADECHRRGFSKVLVLGIKLTMQGGLYNEVLNSKNITAIIPTDSVCDKIEHLIKNEIIPSKINSSTVEDIQEDIQKYDCDAVILGCTELPVVYNENNLGKPIVDTTRLLAHYALKLASEDNPSSK